MIYFLDTNIFISFVKNKNFRTYFQNEYGFSGNTLMTSTVVEGELKSLLMQHKWGFNKRRILNTIFGRSVISPIKTQKIIQLYAEIDAYSQGKHPTLKLPKSARNMGKNDICLPRNLGGIAATAAALELTLITTDRDFDHLDGVFLDVVFINISEF